MVAKKAKKEETIEITPDFSCERCKLCKGIKKYIKPVGNINGRILVIGDMPELDDVYSGMSFSGPRGMVLQKYIEKSGLSIDDLYLVNTTLCPTPGQRAPSTEEVNACKPHIRWIEKNMPNLQYIVPMGVIALKSCINLKDMQHKRGSIIEKNELKYFPVFNPISALSNPASESIIIQDLTLLKNLIEGKIEYGTYRVIDDLGLFNSVIDAIKNQVVVAVDIETSNYRHDINKISSIIYDEVLGISLSWKEKTGVYIPFIADGKEIWNYDTKQYIVKQLNDVLTAHGKKLVLHGGKFDAKFLKKTLNIDLTKYYMNPDGRREMIYFFDTMLAAFI